MGQFIFGLSPTLGYKKRLKFVMKWVHIVKEAYKMSNQNKRPTDHLDMPQILLFCTLWFLCLFL